MKISFLSKIKILFLFFSFIVLYSSATSQVSALERETNVIRVGYPIQKGLTMRDENGKLSGYTYDYLMEISQYTGWKYEFVFVDGSVNEQIIELMRQLKSGEIDLLGGMNYDESLINDYSYSGYCYGINYSGLFVTEESMLREASLYNSPHLRIGVHSIALKSNQKLEQFAQMNNLNMEQVITDSYEDFCNMIDEGRADAILSTDLAMAEHEDMYAVAHFSPSPFYFTTTKGNTDIVQMLDYALSTIDQVNPNFMVQLYNYYFSQLPTTVLLSEEEKKYIENCGTLEVVMYDNKPPFQYVDTFIGKPVGITVEVLDYIAEAMGLSFHYNTVSTYHDYISFIESGKADIAADALINYQDAIDTKSALTLPWYSLPISMVFREDTVYNKNESFALPYFLRNVIDVPENAVYYDSVEECLEAVQDGTVDYCYAGEFCTQFYFNTLAYDDLKRLNQADIASQKVCFGICNSSDINLISIFNKCITSMPKEQINEIAYHNIYQQQEPTLDVLLKNNRNFILAVIMTILTSVFLLFFCVKNRQQKRIAFENKRYNTISNLANEYFYEYIMLKDELILSEKCADYFQCDMKIQQFCKKLSALQDKEISGIWQLGKNITNDKEGSFEISCQMPDNTRQWFKIFSSKVYNKKKQIHVVGKIANIQEIKSEQIRLEQQASIDGLTGIYNIATIKKLIQKHLEQFDSYAPCALIILDIDDFKQINDNFGHYNGDTVLVQAANMISSAFPSSLVGRLGGDEFVVFVPKAQQEELEIQCTLLCKTMLKKTDILLGTAFSWSIGISWARKGQAFETLYKEADAALYATKSKTKNGYSFYEG